MDAHAEHFQGPRQPAISGNHQDNFGEAEVRPEQGRTKTDRGGVGAGDGSGEQGGQETGRTMKDKEDRGAIPSFNLHQVVDVSHSPAPASAQPVLVL